MEKLVVLSHTLSKTLPLDFSEFRKSQAPNYFWIEQKWIWLRGLLLNSENLRLQTFSGLNRNGFKVFSENLHEPLCASSFGMVLIKGEDCPCVACRV